MYLVDRFPVVIGHKKKSAVVVRTDLQFLVVGTNICDARKAKEIRKKKTSPLDQNRGKLNEESNLSDPGNLDRRKI